MHLNIRNALSACAIVLVHQGACAQTLATLKQPIGSEQKAELLEWANELFTPEVNVGFSISTKAAYGSLEGTQPNRLAEAGALEALNARLKTEPSNPMLHNEFGNYYKLHGDMARARTSYQRALDLLTPESVQGQGFSTLAIRGSLRHNLGIEGGYEDMQEALRANPTDSIAFFFLPMLQLFRGEFVPVREEALAVLNRPHSSYTTLAYIYLASAQCFEALMTTLLPAMGDSTKSAELRAIAYDATIDFTPLVEQAARYPRNMEVQRVLRMARLLGMMSKLAVADRDARNKVTMPLSKAEKADVQKVIQEAMKDLKSASVTNKFGPLNSLAFAHLLLEKNEEALRYAEEAIKAFPTEHTDDQFNPMEAHNLVLYIHHAKGDTAAFRKALARTIAAKPTLKADPQLHATMAHHFLQQKEPAMAERWALSALKIDPNHIPARCAAIHALYVQGFRSMIPNHLVGIDDLVTDSKQAETLMLQFAFYRLLEGNVDDALDNFRKVEDADPDSRCELCDRVIGKYILVKKD